MNALKHSIFSIALLLLAACSGGGGGGDSENSGNGGNNNTPLPTLSIANASIVEGDAGQTIIMLTVTLSTESTSTVSVNFSTADISAIAGVDYNAANGTLQITAGNTTGQISVQINGDTDVESDETLTVTLASPVNATLAQAAGIGTITNDDALPPQGLDTRPDNQTCIAPARPTNNATVSVIDAFPLLPDISLPTKILLEPVADPRWFVLEKNGVVTVFDPDAATATSTYIDLTVSRTIFTDLESGLLGMAFHPNYPTTPEIFLSYTIPHSGPASRSVFSRFILDNVVTPGAGTIEQVIMVVDQDSDNHNGGDIAFGPDGFLYIGLGDGGGYGDSLNRAQDTDYLLGSMLRIDVTGPGVSFPTTPYVIPPGNPFFGNATCGPGLNAAPCPEIYAWGLRNPWRWTFDADSNELWLADVGQDNYEEIDIIENGGNYGWPCREAAHNFRPSAPGCGPGLIEPVSEYPRSEGASITGGYVYRGSAIPELIGRYVFGDYATGKFWALQSDGTGGYTNDEIINTGFGPTSFGMGTDGELYFTDIYFDRIRKIVPAGAPTPDTIPTLLSNSGCVDPGDITQPYSGLAPYDLNAPFWSDGANKSRFIGLPNGTMITRDVNDDWEFPNGTIIIKNFSLGGNLVETRHLMKHPDGIWAGYTYEWNALQTEATRVEGGKTVFTNGQNWIFPSESQCMACHTSAAGFSLGPETAQLNKDFTYPSTGRTANQLETLDHVLMFTTPLPGPASGLPVLTDPTDTGASLDLRARAYLHTNCAQCHRPGGPTPSSMDLRYTTALGSTNACDALPQEGDLGIVNARLIAPGDASRSILVERANRRDSHGMPPVGSNLVDGDGVTLLTNWINGLASCL